MLLIQSIPISGEVHVIENRDDDLPGPCSGYAETATENPCTGPGWRLLLISRQESAFLQPYVKYLICDILLCYILMYSTLVSK